MCPDDCRTISGSCNPSRGCKDCCKPPQIPQQPLSPPPPPAVVFQAPSSYQNHSKLPIFVISLVVILATGFFLFTCYTIYRFTSYWIAARRRRRSARRDPDGDDDGPDEFLAEEHGPVVDHPIWYIRTVGLDPSAIAAITVVKYKRGDGLIDGTDCSVCLSEFQDDEALRLLPKCSHAFHIPCIDTWLRSHINCPLCRARIVVDTTAVVPAPAATAVQNPGLVEEINQETVIDSETSDDEASGTQSRAEIAVKFDNECGLNDEVQPVRRSVSMDSMSAAMISAAVAGAIQGRRNNDKQLSGDKEAPSTITGRVKERNGGINQGLLRLIGSPSIDRYMQSGPSAVKRSLSCSAKVFLQRHGSRNRGSILPQ